MKTEIIIFVPYVGSPEPSDAHVGECEKCRSGVWVTNKQLKSRKAIEGSLFLCSGCLIGKHPELGMIAT